MKKGAFSLILIVCLLTGATLTTVSASEPVIAVCYDANGVMVSVDFLANSGDGASAPDNAASMKLFWADSAWAPKCAPTTVPISAAD